MSTRGNLGVSLLIKEEAEPTRFNKKVKAFIMQILWMTLLLQRRRVRGERPILGTGCPSKKNL